MCTCVRVITTSNLQQTALRGEVFLFCLKLDSMAGPRTVEYGGTTVSAHSAFIPFSLDIRKLRVLMSLRLTYKYRPVIECRTV